MKPDEKEIDRELEAALRMLTSKPQDAQALLRARERVESIREEMLKKYGVREIAVQLIREIRDAD